MIRLGTDIVYIPRIQAAIERFGKRFLERVYTNYEQQNCSSDTLTRTSINKLGAAKAVVKTLGTGWRGVSYTDVEIRRHPSGMPYVVLYNNAATIVAALGGEKGDKGNKGNKGDKGEKGEKGEKGIEENMLFTSPSSPPPWIPPYPSALIEFESRSRLCDRNCNFNRGHSNNTQLMPTLMAQPAPND